MRQLIDAGTPKEVVVRGYMPIFLILMPDGAFLVALLVLRSAQLGFAATFLPRVSADKEVLFQQAVRATPTPVWNTDNCIGSVSER